ncbi:hypothetical protein FALBO_649 [Fusarium albosuccineum]|uniref:Uncharacterized protein n=1 Tax=Fusarium albosuccineum TaxID=1237068 RepID=A0A8H4LPF0_9HYPO|nr:hypothetical protein FALBO_649 [Fusarium albosuccineum]
MDDFMHSFPQTRRQAPQKPAYGRCTAGFLLLVEDSSFHPARFAVRSSSLPWGKAWDGTGTRLLDPQERERREGVSAEHTAHTERTGGWTPTSSELTQTCTHTRPLRPGRKRSTTIAAAQRPLTGREAWPGSGPMDGVSAESPRGGPKEATSAWPGRQ